MFRSTTQNKTNHLSADAIAPLRRPVTHSPVAVNSCSPGETPPPPAARPRTDITAYVVAAFEEESVTHTHTHSPPKLLVDIIVISQPPHLPQNGSFVFHWLGCLLSLCRERQQSVYVFVCVHAWLYMCASVATDGFTLWFFLIRGRFRDSTTTSVVLHQEIVKIENKW